MYIEPFVFPEEDAWVEYINGYTYYPWLALNAQSNNHDDARFHHMYGMVILAVALDQHESDPDLVRQTWEASQSYVEDYGLTLALLLPTLGYDWDGAYREFMAANTVMDYEGGDAFPAVTLEESVDSLPASGSSSADTAPQTLGQNYIRIDTGGIEAERFDLLLTFRGPSHADWLVLVVGTSADAVLSTGEMELDTGQGELLVEDAGQYGQVFLVISPRDHAGDGMQYEWSAEAVGVEGGEDDDDDSAMPDDDDSGADDDDTEQVDDDVEEADGCACSAGVDGPPVAPLFLLAVLVATRRRRSG